MIDLEYGKNEFQNYINKFDKENSEIKRKIDHSYRVMVKSEIIAKSLGLKEEEVQLAELIGLLHDVGRFVQRTKYKTQEEQKHVDHGDLGVEILKSDNYIRKFIKTDKYDNVIYKAIKNHNKYEIEKNLSKEELEYSKIIRDADKLDIMYQVFTIFWKNREKEVEDGKISDEVYNEFLEKKMIDKKIRNTEIDNLVGFLSFIFDINYKKSLEYIKEEKYIEKICRKFKFENEETQTRIYEIEKLSKSYVEEKIDE